MASNLKHLRPAATDLPTWKAVERYADKLRSEALKITTKDCYAKPWYPTSSAALRLVQRCTKTRRENAVAAGLAPDAVKAEELMGPSDALAYMSAKWAQSISEYREETITSERAQARHVRRQKQARRDREAQLLGMTPGQRIDRAIASMSTISTVKAQALDPDKLITGSRDNDESTGTPSGPGDPASRARHIAAKAVREIEDELDDATRRRVELEAA